ncbi:MAG: nucleoside 2-deoxyribosyltransferase [Rhodocyclaceae bacterium]|nr:nucleoside 2-deoxyribosyltransferase [Rhodocyclaceae bacterium]MDZ4214130.1 nucleoside 2-deoxyribosyltransferase [Rhodocyclaceae bacterium]
MKIYLAGPDVFRPDVLTWAESARETCCQYGYEPLIPIDHGETDASKIFQANLDLIRKAQIVVANLNPFRGAEPDSGTCFELGYALALGKKTCGYVENVDLPLNLMLAVPSLIVEGGLAECLKQLRSGIKETSAPAATLPENPLIRKTIEAAIRYLHWVADGKVTDGHAVATVAEQYKVREETVRAWIDAWSGISLASNADYQPDDIIRQMKISGRQYRSL